MNSNPLKTVTCPFCGCPPVLCLPGLSHWFCPNEDCEVLGWDPYSTAQQIVMDFLADDTPPEMPDTSSSSR